MSKPSAKKIQVIGFITFALILLGLSLTLFFLDQNKDVRQQAFVGTSDVNDYCPGGECVAEFVKSKSGEYSSPTGVYSLYYDQDVWQTAAIPSKATSTDQEQSFFVSSTPWGFATIYLNAVALSEAQSEMSVLALATNLETQISSNLAENIRYVGKEIVYLNNREAIRFDFSEVILGRETTYQEYVLLGDNHYVEAEARSSGTFGMTAMIENLLGSIKIGVEAQVKGTTDEQTFNDLELSELVSPSVANVLHLYCKEVLVSPELKANYLKSSYPFCSGMTGSGFLVGESGLVATNGHVVTSYPEQDFFMNLSMGHPVFVEFVVDFVRELAFAQGIETTAQEGQILAVNTLQDPSGMQMVFGYILEFFNREVFTVKTLTDLHYVDLGTKPFNFSSEELTPQNINNFVTEEDNIFSAELMGFDFANFFTKEIISGEQKPNASDVAILKINKATNYVYPNLQISDASKVKEGEQILIFGFPGIVSGDESLLLDYTGSSAKVTVTKGIVSSIKQDTGGRTLIQTDASVGHGNSGGPAFNQKGEVIGIATYGLSEETGGGNFNFLRDTADLLELSKSTGVEISTSPGKTYQDWQSALEYFWENHFTKSLSYLNSVVESYPTHPKVFGVISEAEQNIKDGKDVDLLFGIQKVYVYVGGGLLAVLLIVGGVMLVLKKKNDRVPPVAPQAPLPVAEPSQMPEEDSIKPVDSPIMSVADFNQPPSESTQSNFDQTTVNQPSERESFPPVPPQEGSI